MKNELIDYIVYCQFTEIVKAEDRDGAERKIRDKYPDINYDSFDVNAERIGKDK
ncbi:hypothetical protein ACFLQL_00605 [Verrucomicrobiota bacterium]